MKLILAIKNSTLAPDHPFLNQKYNWKHLKYPHGLDNESVASLTYFELTPKWYTQNAMKTISGLMQETIVSDEFLLSDYTFYDQLLKQKLFGATCEESFKSLSLGLYPIDANMQWLSTVVDDCLPKDVFEFFDEDKMTIENKIQLLNLDIEVMILDNTK